MSDYRTIIREEIIRLLEDVTNVHSMDATKGIPQWLADIPGVPFNGRIFYTSTILPNETRALLMRWLKFAVRAKKKFGEPQQWPQRVIDVSQKLAGEYENKATERGFSSSYRQF